MKTKFNRSRAALLTATSTLAMITAGHARAADAPAAAPTQVEEVIITGFRASLASALAVKKDSNLIIESITAEDMGKFPDQNITESLQRLPGVQIDRQNGQGTKVRIRGLDQNVTVLNGDIFVSGLEIFRLGEGNARQDSSLEGVPSELIAAVDVYKSPDASLLEGGLGGIVNLKTRNALTLPDTLTFSGVLRGNRGGDGDWNPTASVILGYKFSDRFALLGTVSYDKTFIHTDALGGENRGTWAYLNRPVGTGVTQTSTANIWSPEYRYATNRDQERERLGMSLNADLQVTDSLQFTADWFHSDLKILTSEASIKFPFNLESATLQTGSFTTDSNGILQTGRVTALSAEAISFVQNAEAVTDNYQLAANWDNGGPLTASFRAAYSKASYDSTSGNNDVRYTQYGVRNGTALGLTPNPSAPTTFSFDYVNGDNPTFTPVNPAQFTTPSNVFAKSHWVFGESTETENQSIRADFKYEPGFGEEAGLTLSFGGRLAKRTVDTSYGRYLADYSGKGELDAHALGVGDWTPLGYFQDGAIGLKSCELPLLTPGHPPCTGRFGDSPAVITPYETAASNPGRFETVTIGGITALVQNRGQMKNPVSWIQGLYPTTPFAYYEDPLESFSVEEKTSSAYFMVDVGRRDDRFHLNGGARVVKTELTINASSTPISDAWYYGTDSWNGVLANPVQQSTVREYTDVLPSVNAVFEVNDTDKVRASAARVVARQNLFDLGKGSSFDFTRNTTVGDPNFNRFIFTNGNGGNAELDPYRANQFDLAYERYFGRQGLISASFFYKSVDSFIQTDTVSRSVADGSVAGSTVGTYTSPVNGEGGSVKGIELAAQYAFENGLGFNVNYTYSDSESPFSNDFDSSLPIPGVSKTAYNLQGYYENNGFEARLSYAWRDKAYLGNFGFGSGADTHTLGIWQAAYGQLDGQVAYSVTPALKVTFEGINLTEEASSAYLQFENLPFRYLSGDRRFLLGLRYRFGM